MNSILRLALALALAAIFAPYANAADPTFEVLHSFRQGPVGPNSLIQGTDGNFYGTTTTGGPVDYDPNTGKYGNGTIFKMPPNGARTTLVEFTGNGAANKGASPQALVQGADGNFYGTTLKGGAGNLGTIFKMTPDGVLTTLVEFTGSPKGAEPRGALVQGSNGNFYGTTSGGGTTGNGTIFKMTPDGVLRTLVHFTGKPAGGGPWGALVQGSDGNFYGTTKYGGAIGIGTVFKMTPSGVLTTLVEFTGDGAVNKGANPQGGLVQGSDGNFYGTTSKVSQTLNFLGGIKGTIFRMTPAGVLTTLMEFSGNGPSNHPVASLVQGSDGNFYGMTYGDDSLILGGGDELDDGTVFRITPAGMLTTLVEFTGTDGPNKGRFPASGLVQGSDGKFYGTTRSGGAARSGTVFSVTPSGALTTLVEFTSDDGIHQGIRPTGSLVQADDGNLYGTTYNGGASNAGTAFKLTPTGELTTLAEFDRTRNGGWGPIAGLVPGDNGTFYGVTGDTDPDTSRFGITIYPYDVHGTVFKMTRAGGLTTLAAFPGGRDHVEPSAGLVRGRDGNFYGTTCKGGTGGYGRIFKLTPGGMLTTLVEFTFNGATNKGAYPRAALVQGSDGNFYGTTSEGGGGYYMIPGGSSMAASGAVSGTVIIVGGGDTTKYGTVFKMTPAGSLTTLVEFTLNGATNRGSNPTAALVQGSDGNFYGTTSEGGSANHGTVFKMTPAGVLTTLVEFTGTEPGRRGSVPAAALLEGSDGNFYGTTRYGGANDAGTIFKVTPAGEFTSLFNFAGWPSNRGKFPRAALIKGSDNSFYGTIEYGGSGSGGALFRLRFGPAPVTLAASDVVFDGATLKASVKPNELATTVHFEYGLTAAYGTATSTQDVAAGTSAVSVEAAVNGLAPNTTYHYRVVATNSDGKVIGADRTFTTPGVGNWDEHSVARNLPAADGGAVDIGALTFTGGAGIIEAVVTASNPGWSVAKCYVIPIRNHLGNGSPGTWLKVLPTHETAPHGVERFDLNVNVSGATALLRLRTVGSSSTATATIAIKTIGLKTFVNSSATAAATVPAQTIGGNAVDEVKGKAGFGAAPGGSAALDVNGGDTRGLHLRPRSTLGAPTTGAWSKGTIILDSAANLFICTAPGTPGTWKKVGP